MSRSHGGIAAAVVVSPGLRLNEMYISPTHTHTHTPIHTGRVCGGRERGIRKREGKQSAMVMSERQAEQFVDIDKEIK